MIKNIVKHAVLVTKHRWVVFKLCCKVGIPFRGLIHDLSKFSITEFWESVKYYQGNRSPIPVCRKEKGYSEAWLHHKGKNKHHFEYWLDFRTESFAPIIPYKYIAETACDKLAASVVYNGKNYTDECVYNYWVREMQNVREKMIVNPKIANFFEELFIQVKNQGIDKTYTKSNLKALYKKYCIDDKTEYVYEFKGEWKEKKGE